MPIQVTCPGCHKRFTVSDKYAGQKGPCPKCKTQIQIPDKSQEVVIHAPEEFGPKDAKGTAVLKPIARREAKFSTPAAVLIGAAVVAVLVVALILRGPIVRGQKGAYLEWVLGAGAVLLGPMLAYSGYSFLRNEELEPHRGRALLLRSLICGVGYAALWGAYALVVQLGLPGEKIELFQLLIIAPIMIALGGGIAFASMDLDFGTGLIHYAFYLVATVVLRLIMGLPPY